MTGFNNFANAWGLTPGQMGMTWTGTVLDSTRISYTSCLVLLQALQNMHPWGPFLSSSRPWGGGGWGRVGGRIGVGVGWWGGWGGGVWWPHCAISWLDEACGCKSACQQLWAVRFTMVNHDHPAGILPLHGEYHMQYHIYFTEYEYEYEIFIALISQRNIRVQGSTSIKIYGYQHTTNKLNTKWKYKAMVQNHWIQCRTKMTMKWLVHIVAYTTGHSCNNPPGGHRTRRGRHCSETI